MAIEDTKKIWARGEKRNKRKRKNTVLGDNNNKRWITLLITSDEINDNTDKGGAAISKLNSVKKNSKWNSNRVGFFEMLY